MRKVALFSVQVHEGLESLVRTLIKADWQIIATRDAHNFLRDKGIETTDVSEFTGVNEDYGFPPTLHPRMEAALTTDCEDRIDLVYDIPYGPSVGNDVGGRTLLALAAKGNRIPVIDSDDMRRVVRCITQDGKLDAQFQEFLISKVNHESAMHYLKLCEHSDDYYGIIGSKTRLLREGENMYQKPAQLYKTDSEPLSICNFRQVAGNVPCFTNTSDLDSIIETLCKMYNSLVLNGLNNPYVVVAAKHGNACGAGVSLKDQSEALESALWGNAKGMWGGEVITNFPINETTANLLKKSETRKKIYGDEAWMLDVIAAPAMNDDAIKILSSNPNRKLLVNPSLTHPTLRSDARVMRQVRGGFVTQPPANYILDLNHVAWTGIPADKELYIPMIIAWSVAFTSFHGGNETAIARDRALIGVGGGPSTYDAASTAVTRAKEYGHDTNGSVFGADAFFPFTDVPEIILKAGCLGGTVPAGGKNEKEVVKFFESNKMSVGFIPEEYRGFCRH